MKILVNFHKHQPLELRNSIALLALPMVLAGPAKALTFYVAPLDAANGSSSIQSGTTYMTNLGYAFKTGPSGPFDIDGINIA